MTAAALFRRSPVLDPAAGSDRDLLRQFADGRDDAFAALVRRYGRLVFATCLRVLNHRADAEDAYQACFLVLARRAGSVRSDEKLAGWLHTVAVRTATEVRRMRARAKTAPSLTHPAPKDTPRDTAEQSELAAVLDEELAKLPDHYRLAVVLCELNGIGRKTAAKELGIAEGTLSSRLAKARKLLAEALASRGFAGVSAGALTAALATSAVAKISATVLDSVHDISTINFTVQSVAETVVKAMYATKLKAGAMLAVLLALTGGAVWTTSAGAGQPPGAGPAPAKAKDDKPDPVAVRAEKLEAFVATFRDDTEHKAKLDHPIWKRWAKEIGEDRPARELFAQMLQVPDAAKILDQLEAKPDTAATVYREQATALLKLAEKRCKPKRLTPSSGYSAGENTFVAYLGTFPGTEKVFDADTVDAERWPLMNLTHQHLWSLGPVVLDPATGGIILRAPRTAEERAISRRVQAPSGKLFLISLLNRRHEETVELGLSSWNADPKALVPFAKAILADAKQPARVRAATFLPLLRANAVECDADIAAFEEDATVWMEGLSHGDGKTDNLQVRDVAVAVRLLLRKQMLADFGFVRAVQRPGHPLPAELWQQTTVCMTFPDEKSRAAAHEKALAFLKDAPKLKAPEPKPEEPKKVEPAEPLVKLLGSKEFAEREAAEKALRELGAKALPAVQGGAKSENPEVAARCRKLVGLFRKDAREAFAGAFFADKERTKPFDHPVWKRYVELVGDSPASRAVFAELLKYKYPDGLEVLDAADRDPARADELYRAHLADVGKQGEWLLKYTFSIRDMIPGHTADIAAYTLLLGSYRTTATPPEKLPSEERLRYTHGRNYVLAFGDGLKEGFAGKLAVLGRDAKVIRVAEAGPPGTDKVFARLYAAFLTREPVRTDGWASPNPFLVFEDPTHSPVMPESLRQEALPAARRILDDPAASALQRAVWLPLLRRYGEPSDAGRLTRLFTETGVLPPCGVYPGIDFTRVEVREWAVGTALVLRGRNPADFGFDHFKEKKLPDRNAGDGDDFTWAPGKFAIGEPGGGIGFNGGTERAPATKEKTLKTAIEWLDGEEKKDKDDPAERWVKLLGSKNFAERETAERLLRDHGTKAYEAVMAGLKSDNPEIVARCRRLMPVVRAAWLARPESEHLKRFLALTGDTAHAKELFREMVADHRHADILMAAKPGELYVGFAERLLKDYDAGIEEAWELKRKLVRERTGRNDIEPLGHVISTKLPSRGMATLLYFVGTFTESAKAAPNVGEDERRHYLEMLQYAMTAHRKDLKVKDGPEAFPAEARKLFAAWLGNRTDAKAVRYGMEVARTHELPEVLPVARALLADDKRSLLDRTPALHVIALQGTKEDLARVKPFLDDKTIFFHSPNHDEALKRRCTVEVRDVAHAVVAKLFGAEPMDLGFDFCELYKLRGANPFQNDYVLGFSTDEARAKAHAKVKALLPEEPKKEDPAALVGQLGSKDFAEREAAQAKLKELGAPAYAAVQDGLKSANPEIVARCKKLLPDVRAAWLARPESEVWKKFAAVTGDTAEARKLFVEMAADRDHADILTADKPGEQYAAHLNRLLDAVRKGYTEAERAAQGRTGIIYPAQGWPTRPQAALFFFLGTAADTATVRPEESDSNRVYYGNMIPAALNILRGGDNKFPAEVGKLFTAWVAVRRDPASVNRGFELARSHGFQQALPLARGMLANDRLTLAERAPALFVVAVLGSKADLDLIRPFLDSDAEYHRTRYTGDGGKVSPVVVQVRDIAHAAVGWLLGAEPRDLGFEFCEMYKKTGAAAFQGYFYLGFMSEEKRAKAHAAAQALLAKAPAPQGPAKPKKLPKAAPPSAEANAAIAAVSAGWTPATVEDKAIEAAKKLKEGEDRAQLYSAVAHLLSNGHLREEFARVRRLSDLALGASRDPILRWKARSLQASTVYISGKPFAERRRAEAEILIAGYAELLVQDLPDQDPEWPASPGKPNFGPQTPEQKAEREARLEEYRKAQAETAFVKDLVFGRKVLLMQLRDAYKPRPDDRDRTEDGLTELRALAAKSLTAAEVKTLIARVLDEK